VKDLWHRRHFDFETYDRIELVQTLRYKTSGLSGDEWRTGINVKLYFKGEVVHEIPFSDMRAALTLLIGQLPEMIPGRVLELEKTKCDQPGCAADAVNRFQVRRITSESGEYLDMKEVTLTYYRQFCAKHSKRGNASREDCDKNYIKLGPSLKGK